MSKIFTEKDEFYTNLGLELDRKAEVVLEPLMKEMVEKGATVREAEYLATSAAALLACEMRLDLMLAVHRTIHPRKEV